MDKLVAKANKKIIKEANSVLRNRKINIAVNIVVILTVLTAIVGGALYVVWSDMAYDTLDKVQQQFLNVWNKISLFLASFNMAFMTNKCIVLTRSTVMVTKGARKALFENINKVKNHIDKHLNKGVVTFNDPYFGLIIKSKMLYFTVPSLNHNIPPVQAMGELWIHLSKFYSSVSIEHNPELDSETLAMYRVEIAQAKVDVGLKSKSCGIKIVNMKALAQYPELMIDYIKALMNGLMIQRSL